MEVYNKMKDEGIEPGLGHVQHAGLRAFEGGDGRAGDKVLERDGLYGAVSRHRDLHVVDEWDVSEGGCIGAVKLLEVMEDRGCTPNECTYNTLLMGLCKAKCLEKGMELYEVMKEGGMKLEGGAYATFVRALCRANKVAEAYGVFDYVIESKSLSEVKAYLALESSVKGVKRASASEPIDAIPADEVRSPQRPEACLLRARHRGRSSTALKHSTSLRSNAPAQKPSKTQSLEAQPGEVGALRKSLRHYKPMQSDSPSPSTRAAQHRHFPEASRNKPAVKTTPCRLHFQMVDQSGVGVGNLILQEFPSAKGRGLGGQGDRGR
ncbi:uncharacterized protein A4U43_C03F31470 [Asparagus officinalis]|uniref:Pentacotripeptide-repeat region of PRORP domain-containing protein n=1 Tax=Asparagus officinalis TaxID=4686 RepID=A0A5P1FED6_ASPOF|nr:uncharacterized protein A4U43_C03F31470 [Asparagus officinalis]